MTAQPQASAPLRVFAVARVTLQLSSPLSIGAGASDDLRDAFVVTDACGLPTIPGTTLAGVLRAAWRRAFGDDSTRARFGYITDSTTEDDGRDSAVLVSFGVLHGSYDAPHSGDLEAADRDPLLRAARAPLTRNHVRIDHDGTADDRGLYDRDMVPVGHRFTFELVVRDDIVADAERDLMRALSLLASPHMALGARSRSGLGQFKLVRVAWRAFDLRSSSDFQLYRRLPVALHRSAEGILRPLKLDALPDVAVAGRATLELQLRARQGWSVGGGQPTDADVRPRGDGDDARQEPVDLVPWREPRVVWAAEGQGDAQRLRGYFNPRDLHVALPGSAIKGALRHRTAFYHNALVGAFADGEGVALSEQGAFLNRALWALFGGLDPDNKDPDARPCTGRVTVEDADVTHAGVLGFQDHVTLDRFTGGAFAGHLFDEAFYWRSRLTVRLHIDDAGDRTIDANLREALRRAVEDLCEGRLALGSGDARGHGRFEVTASRWTDDGAWINADVPATAAAADTKEEGAHHDAA